MPRMRGSLVSRLARGGFQASTGWVSPRLVSAPRTSFARFEVNMEQIKMQGKDFTLLVMKEMQIRAMLR